VRNYAFQLSPYTWQMTLGVTLLLIIFFLPGGVWSLVGLVRERRQ
jgi:branched-chain amino acid transport system permease protein